MISNRLKHLAQDRFILIVILSCHFPNSIIHIWSRIYSNEMDLDCELGRSGLKYLPFNRHNEISLSTKTLKNQSDYPFYFLSMDGVDLTIDSNENIYAVGTTMGPPSRHSIVLMKVDSAGNQLWNRTWSMFNVSMGKEITMDNEENIFILGLASSYWKNYLVLIKWDSFGNQLWNRTWEASGEGGLGIDNEGYIYTMSTSWAADKSMLIKWDTEGNQRWNRTWGDSKLEPRFGAGNVVVDTNGSIYTVGTRYSLGMELAKWDTEGNQCWNRTWKQFDFNSGKDVTVDNNGDVYTIGETQYYDRRQYNTTLVKWDPSGNQVWNVSRDIQSNNRRIEKIKSLVTSSTGNIYAVGRLTEVLFPYISYTYLLVMKWDAMGNYIGIKIWNETCSSTGSGITINNEKIYCIGGTLVVIFSDTGFSDVASISTPSNKCYPGSISALFLTFISDLFNFLIIPLSIGAIIFVSLGIKKVTSKYLTKKSKKCDE